MARILLIEDDKRLASLVKRGLEQEGFDVSLATDGLEGKEAALANDFELIISDIILPEINGLELCKIIRSYKPGVPILMLTALGDTDDKVEGFDAGADDYLVKPFEFRELYARIRALIKRAQQQSKTPERHLRYDSIEMDVQLNQVSRDGQTVTLTPKEFKLLRYLLENPERVLSRPEIAEKVWDTHFDTGTNFIDVYINYLRNKIDKPFDKKLIHTQPGVGFILKQDGD